MNDDDKQHNAAKLLEQLQRSQAFHQEGIIGIEEEFSRLRRWQSARLARTHADLLHHPRYQAAAIFFLEELYGDRDLRQRERDLTRIAPMMSRILPAGALHSAALALELNALSYELDAAMTRILIASGHLRDTQLDEAAYVAAYRRCAGYEFRRHQIDLIEQLGEDLEKIVRKHLIRTALKVAKTPARLAGVGELHRFLEAGFHAFRQMGADARTFVATITRRERIILEQISAGHAHPFELQIETAS